MKALRNGGTSASPCVLEYDAYLNGWACVLEHHNCGTAVLDEHMPKAEK